MAAASRDSSDRMCAIFWPGVGMKQVLGAVILLGALCGGLSASEPATYWLLETDRGEILIELERERAPKTTKAIVQQVRGEHYSGTVFHRVIAGFVIQAGGYDRDLEERPVAQRVVNESGNGLRNERGTIGLARGADPHSGGAQFYINLEDNEQLDPRPERWGYAVFGRVRYGMEVVAEIAAIPTQARGDLDADVPEETIAITDSHLMGSSDGEAWLSERTEQEK